MSEPKPEPTPFERMQELAAKVVSIPKEEVDKREKEWKKLRQINSEKNK